MKSHYTEADLLETYYTQPGDSMPVMMHLADCSECAARYEALDRKLHLAAGCESERPETFWTRQRMAIIGRVSTGTRSRFSPRRFGLAAAILLVLLGGTLTYNRRVALAPQAATPVVSQTARATAPPTQAKAKAADVPTVTLDAWQSDELQDFHSVVDWESWVQQPERGEQL